MTQKRLHVGVFAFAMLLFTQSGFAAARKDNADDTQKALLRECEAMLSDAPIGRYQHLGQSWNLLDLINPDPAKNLAVQFPTILMNNDQMDYYVANKVPRRKIKDPAYRRNTYWYYPVISAGLPEVGGRQIIGHYEAIQRTMEYIESRAKGKRASKMLGYVGPAGTGKTEIGNLLVTARAHLGMTDPDYAELTFEFVNLQGIAGLEPLLFGATEGQASPALQDVSLQRSPIVLLPESLQKRVIDIARENFRDAVGKKGIQMDPMPFLTPSRKTQEVLDMIVAHYQATEKKSTITDRDYMNWISKHVKIVRRVHETNQPPAIIRYLGKHPDMSTLFFTENLALSQFYGPKSPLSYSYGLIPANDGKPMFLDEFFRQTSEVRDSSLDLAQNQVAQNGGAPPETLNVTIYFATNDESIAEAQENGGAKAHLDRTIRLPMRHAIEPWHVVKIGLNDIGRSRFVMKPVNAVPDVLSQDSNPAPVASEVAPVTTEEFKAYDPQEVIPDLESGELVGPDGRYALYYRPDPKDKPVLIAPRALWMIGLVASATRLVTDPKVFAKANGKNVEFSTLAKYGQYFMDAKERLHVLNGTKQVHPAVAEELQKAKNLNREGQTGIGAREVENWLSEALAMARNYGGALTPVIVDKAFQKLLDNGGITSTPTERTQWIQLLKLVKAEFVLPALSSDVLAILQGQGRAERLYDELKLEILTLSTDRDAEFIEGEGNHRIPIDKKRLIEIYGLFREISGYDFDPNMLKDFHLQVNRDAAIQRHPALMEAARRFLSQREIDKTTMSELVEYFDGKAVKEDIRSLGGQAERQLALYGYDRPSFVQALLFVRDQQFVIDRDRKPPQQP